MWNEPSKEKLAKDIPARLYSQENTPMKDQIVYAHFFLGGFDWWVTEYDPKNDEAFGFVCLNGDSQGSEWGYIPISELRNIKISFVEVDYDEYWSPKPAGEVAAIKTYA